MATSCPHVDEINACNDDLAVAISEVIAGNKTLTKKHLISPVSLFKLNPKQTGYKNYIKER
jgi:hypothetical protein